MNRQSFFLLDSLNKPLPASKAPRVIYDPVGRTVTLSRPSDDWLAEGLSYKLRLPRPEGDTEQSGVRAIDGTPLGADQLTDVAFQVGPPVVSPPDVPVSFCRDVLPVFASKCSRSACHGSGRDSAAGLVLETSTGVALTALNRIAQGSNTGPRATSPPAPGRVFGVDMPIIDRGDPGNSWLVYKMELVRPPVVPSPSPGYVCDLSLGQSAKRSAYTSLASEILLTEGPEERSILGDMILGREMPFPMAVPSGYVDEPLTFEERETVRLWIRDLAPGDSVPECGRCSPR